MNYDLEERTSKFGQDVIKFLKDMKEDAINRPLISQLTRSATSIGANYREANQASSKKDFRNKISICRKEANETKHWLEMIKEASPSLSDKSEILWKEAHELTLIFSKIFHSSSLKIKN